MIHEMTIANGAICCKHCGTDAWHCFNDMTGRFAACPGPKPAGDTGRHTTYDVDAKTLTREQFEGMLNTPGHVVIRARTKPEHDRAPWDIPTTFPIRLGLRCG